MFRIELNGWILKSSTFVSYGFEKFGVYHTSLISYFLQYWFDIIFLWSVWDQYDFRFFLFLFDPFPNQTKMFSSPLPFSRFVRKQLLFFLHSQWMPTFVWPLPGLACTRKSFINLIFSNWSFVRYWFANSLSIGVDINLNLLVDHTFLCWTILEIRLCVFLVNGESETHIYVITFVCVFVFSLMPLSARRHITMNGCECVCI